MVLTEKQKEAAAAIAAANPTWSKRHVDMCASFLMPTTNEHYFDRGTPEREAAAQHFRERMTAFLIEMNILPADQAYVRPENWKSPYKKEKGQRAQREAVPQGTETAVPREHRASGEIREPRAGSACGQAWALCDRLYAELQRVPTASEAGDAAITAGLNPGNVKTEMSRWRKFKGYQK